MIIKIPDSDVDAVKFACAVSDLLCNVYTIENNFGLKQIEITELDGRELKPEYAFRIGQVFEKKVYDSQFKTFLTVDHR